MLTPAATLILLRDCDNNLEILLLQRASQSSFLPNHWVFPGGAIEQCDIDNSNSDDTWQIAKQAAIRETQEETQIQCSSTQLIPVSRWIAPQQATKRYDTYFFIATSHTATIQLQTSEIQCAQWITANAALMQYQQGSLPIIPPTLVTLEWLKSFHSSQEAIDYFSQQPPLVFEPKITQDNNQTIILYAGDYAYNTLAWDKTGALHRCVLKNSTWHYLKS